MSTASGQDTDCDGLIDNSGFADQTFDCWVVTGARYLLYFIFLLPLCLGLSSIFREEGQRLSEKRGLHFVDTVA